jgi:hypothetical protein
MANVLAKQIKDLNPEYLELLSGVKDYTSDMLQPRPGPYVKAPNTDKQYLRKLEEIDESWVRSYLINAIIGLKLNRRDGVREYETGNRETLLLQGTDGKTTEEKALLVQERKHTPEEIMVAVKKLPYLLKRLHLASIEKGIGLLSLIISYERAKDFIERTDTRRSPDAPLYPAPRHIMQECVYSMAAYGTLYEHLNISHNSTKHLPPALKWIQGIQGYRDTYFESAMELLNVCETLDIDIKAEDPHDYQQEFIDKLVVTHVASNERYAPDTVKPRTKSDLIQNTMQMYLDFSVNNENVPGETSIARFLALYNEAMNSTYDLRKCFTVDGFIYVSRGCPLQLDVSWLCRHESVKRTALIHADGVAVLCTASNWFYYQTVDVLSDYIKVYVKGKAQASSFAHNTKYGTWREGTVCVYL